MNIIICDDDTKSAMFLRSEIVNNFSFDAVVIASEEKCMNDICSQPDMIFINTCSQAIGYKRLIESIKSAEYKTVICLVGESEDDSIKVYRYSCDMFIMKPYTSQEIYHCMDLFELLSKRIKKVFIRTFGNFDVFVNGQPLYFHNAKSKELFALCVDHIGGTVSMEEAVDKLWPGRGLDNNTKKLYRKALQHIKDLSDAHGIGEMVRCVRGGCMANTSIFECDYYLFLKTPYQYSHLLNGKYLSDYSWGEETLARITSIAYSVLDQKRFDLLF